MPRAVLLLVSVLVLSARPLCAEDAPLSPEETPKHMQLPPGFQATLFAGEPDVVQPIAFTFDDRGRLWVVECLSYPDWDTEGRPGRDRITIFEDTGGDGRFDERRVFYDKGTNFTGIEYGFGGVWVCATPNLVFIPDKDGDDVPDGPPRVLLNGWDLKARHNVFNGLTWGPDGWLYGCNGILSNSRVGKPGTPDEKRVAMNCGVWRYHPVRHEFEVVAHGTTNPWGLDFNEYGEMFITNCVIKHLFHVIPGAHYERMYGQDLNPHCYGLIESCADHIHWGGGKWQDSRGGEGVHDKPGGGHAHAGAMVYLGDNWPDEYRGSLFTCNIHGNRVNRDLLKRHGSGYVASHADDFLRVNDTWFRGLELKYGPDGGVYLTDWSDTGECHDYNDIHRENGRIYKITHGDVKPVHADLAKLSDKELVALHSHRNKWHVRRARRILQERAAVAAREGATKRLTNLAILLELEGSSGSVTRTPHLETLWTLHAIGGLDEQSILDLLEGPNDAACAWAVRLELEDRDASEPVLNRLAELARTAASPRVRRALASALQRLPLEKRWKIAEGLVARGEDAQDANLPLMIWYGIEPLVAADPERATRLLLETRIPLVRQYIARRIASSAR